MGSGSVSVGERWLSPSLWLALGPGPPLLLGIWGK